jgi:hypothetical protein
MPAQHALCRACAAVVLYGWTSKSSSGTDSRIGNRTGGTSNGRAAGASGETMTAATPGAEGQLMQTGPRHSQQPSQPIQDIEQHVSQLAQQVRDLRGALEAVDQTAAQPLAALFVELDVLAECVVLLYHGVRLLAQAGGDPPADQGEGSQGVETTTLIPAATATSAPASSVPRHRPARKVTPEAAARREAALRHVPQTLLPIGPARSALLELARARYDVRAVRSRDGGWLVWLHVVAAARADGNGYVTPKDWQTHWRQLVDVLGIAGAVAGVRGEEELRRRRGT